MTLVFYYDPIAEFNRLFDDALATRPGSCPRARASSAEARRATTCNSAVYRPRLDLHESNESNTVTATFELPGLTSDDVAIDVHENRLTVSGGSTGLDSEEGRSHVVRERRSGKFSRTLHLPIGTKPEDVKAKMENGLLTVTFPKISPEQPAKRIIIQ